MHPALILGFSSLLIMTASLIGVVTVWKTLNDLLKNNLSLWVSFSSGVFFIIAALLLVETLEHSDFTYAIIFFALGAIISFGLFRFLPEFHHHHTDEEHHDAHSRGSAIRILFSDAIHNIGDGILLGAAFAADMRFGLITAGSIFVHELVQEISEFFVLKHAGYSVIRALSLNFIISGTILIGALGSFFLLDAMEMLEGPILALSAGSFFVVVFHDLIPNSIRISREQRNYSKHAAMFILGMTIIILLNLFVGHSEV